MRAHPPSLLALTLLIATLAGAAHAADMAASNAWAPPSSAADTAVAYLTLSNHGADDTLKGADSPCCAHVELHTMDMTGGIMRMRRLDRLELPGGPERRVRARRHAFHADRPQGPPHRRADANPDAAFRTARPTLRWRSR
ncbi:MAG: copper chaperone PCu(A)C [Alphaproteobacteria bacterium]